MNSAGNDIVALRSADRSRATEFRFFSKILSESEQALYQQLPVDGLAFENYVWLLWSVKESAYKYLKRIIPGLVFTPVRIVIQNLQIPTADMRNEPLNSQWENTDDSEEYYRGKVSCGDRSFYFRSKISDKWITTAVDDDENFTGVYWGVKTIGDENYDHQSKAVRSFVLDKLNLFFTDLLQIENSEVGYPVILSEKRNLGIPVSLAHDGRFISYSFNLHSGGHIRVPKTKEPPVRQLRSD